MPPRAAQPATQDNANNNVGADTNNTEGGAMALRRRLQALRQEHGRAMAQKIFVYFLFFIVFFSLVRKDNKKEESKKVGVATDTNSDGVSEAEKAADPTFWALTPAERRNKSTIELSSSKEMIAFSNRLKMWTEKIVKTFDQELSAQMTATSFFGDGSSSSDGDKNSKRGKKEMAALGKGGSAESIAEFSATIKMWPIVSNYSVVDTKSDSFLAMLRTNEKSVGTAQKSAGNKRGKEAEAALGGFFDELPSDSAFRNIVFNTSALASYLSSIVFSHYGPEMEQWVKSNSQPQEVTPTTEVKSAIIEDAPRSFLRDTFLSSFVLSSGDRGDKNSIIQKSKTTPEVDAKAKNSTVTRLSLLLPRMVLMSPALEQQQRPSSLGFPPPSSSVSAGSFFKRDATIAFGIDALPSGMSGMWRRVRPLFRSGHHRFLPSYDDEEKSPRKPLQPKKRGEVGLIEYIDHLLAVVNQRTVMVIATMTSPSSSSSLRTYSNEMSDLYRNLLSFLPETLGQNMEQQLFGKPTEEKNNKKETNGTEPKDEKGLESSIPTEANWTTTTSPQEQKLRGEIAGSIGTLASQTLRYSAYNELEQQTLWRLLSVLPATAAYASKKREERASGASSETANEADRSPSSIEALLFTLFGRSDTVSAIGARTRDIEVVPDGLSIVNGEGRENPSTTTTGGDKVLGRILSLIPKPSSFIPTFLRSGTSSSNALDEAGTILTVMATTSIPASRYYHGWWSPISWLSSLASSSSSSSSSAKPQKKNNTASTSSLVDGRLSRTDVKLASTVLKEVPLFGRRHSLETPRHVAVVANNSMLSANGASMSSDPQRSEGSGLLLEGERRTSNGDDGTEYIDDEAGRHTDLFAVVRDGSALQSPVSVMRWITYQQFVRVADTSLIETFAKSKDIEEKEKRKKSHKNDMLLQQQSSSHNNNKGNSSNNKKIDDNNNKGANDRQEIQPIWITIGFPTGRQTNEYMKSAFRHFKSLFPDIVTRNIGSNSASSGVKSALPLAARPYYAAVGDEKQINTIKKRIRNDKLPIVDAKKGFEAGKEGTEDQQQQESPPLLVLRSRNYNVSIETLSVGAPRMALLGLQRQIQRQITLGHGMGDNDEKSEKEGNDQQLPSQRRLLHVLHRSFEFPRQARQREQERVSLVLAPNTTTRAAPNASNNNGVIITNNRVMRGSSWSAPLLKYSADEALYYETPLERREIVESFLRKNKNKNTDEYAQLVEVNDTDDDIDVEGEGDDDTDDLDATKAWLRIVGSKASLDEQISIFTKMLVYTHHLSVEARRKGAEARNKQQYHVVKDNRNDEKAKSSQSGSKKQAKIEGSQQQQQMSALYFASPAYFYASSEDVRVIKAPSNDSKVAESKIQKTLASSLAQSTPSSSQQINAGVPTFDSSCVWLGSLTKMSPSGVRDLQRSFKLKGDDEAKRSVGLSECKPYTSDDLSSSASGTGTMMMDLLPCEVHSAFAMLSSLWSSPPYYMGKDTHYQGLFLSTCGHLVEVVLSSEAYDRFVSMTVIPIVMWYLVFTALLAVGVGTLKFWTQNSRARLLRVSPYQVIMLASLQFVLNFSGEILMQVSPAATKLTRLGWLFSLLTVGIAMVLYNEVERARIEQVVQIINDPSERVSTARVHQFRSFVVLIVAVSLPNAIPLLLEENIASPLILFLAPAVFWLPQLYLAFTRDGAKGLTLPFIISCTAVFVISMNLFVTNVERMQLTAQSLQHFKITEPTAATKEMPPHLAKQFYHEVVAPQFPLHVDDFDTLTTSFASPSTYAAYGASSAGLAVMIFQALLLVLLRVVNYNQLRKRYMPKWMRPNVHEYQVEVIRDMGHLAALVADDINCIICTGSLLEDPPEDDEGEGAEEGATDSRSQETAANNTDNSSVNNSRTGADNDTDNNNNNNNNNNRAAENTIRPPPPLLINEPSDAQGQQQASQERESSSPKPPPPSLWVTPCKHYFHERCLQTWMEEKMVCPLCRAPLPEP